MGEARRGASPQAGEFSGGFKPCGVAQGNTNSANSYFTDRVKPQGPAQSAHGLNAGLPPFAIFFIAVSQCSDWATGTFYLKLAADPFDQHKPLEVFPLRESHGHGMVRRAAHALRDESVHVRVNAG